MSLVGRSRLLLLFMLIGLLMISGCDEDMGQGSAGGLVGFVVSAGPEQYECCGILYNCEFRDQSPDSGWYYYWLGLKHSGSLVKVGGVRQIALPRAESISIALVVRYVDTVEFGNQHELYLFKASNESEAGIESKAIGTLGPIYVNVPDWYDRSTCYSTCCSPGRKYASVSKSADDVIGVKANISTEYGQSLCGDESSTDYSHSVAFANVNTPGADLPSYQIWAQGGYGRLRLDGDTLIRRFYYFEVLGDSIEQHLDYNHSPNENSTHEYRVDLDAVAGLWSFYLDGSIYSDFQYPVTPHEIWQDSLGRRVSFTGEIRNLEDDMVGTQAYPCAFTELFLRTYPTGSWTPIDITAMSLGMSSDASEWFAMPVDNPSADSVLIWDVNPK